MVFRYVLIARQTPKTPKRALTYIYPPLLSPNDPFSIPLLEYYTWKQAPSRSFTHNTQTIHTRNIGYPLVEIPPFPPWRKSCKFRKDSNAHIECDAGIQMHPTQAQCSRTRPSRPALKRKLHGTRTLAVETIPHVAYGQHGLTTERSVG